MFNILLISTIFVSFGGILYVFSKHLPEIEDEPDYESLTRLIKAQFAARINFLPWDLIRERSLSLTEKTLHRLRLVLLKADNRLMRLIVKIKNGNGKNELNADKTGDFWQNVADTRQKIVIGAPEERVKIELAESPNKIFDIKPAEPAPKTGKSGAKK